MFSSVLLVAVSAFSTFTAAQLPAGQNYSAFGVTPLQVDLTQINSTVKTTWCSNQKAQCPLICGDKGAFPNTCDASNVTGYVCTCNDGSKPNISDYSNTIPTFICQTWLANCYASNTLSQANQDMCAEVVCGSKDARANVNGSSSSTSSAGPTSTSSSSGGASTTSASAAAATTTGAAAALYVAQSYGTGILASGLLGLFAFLL